MPSPKGFYGQQVVDLRQVGFNKWPDTEIVLDHGLLTHFVGTFRNRAFCINRSPAAAADRHDKALARTGTPDHDRVAREYRYQAGRMSGTNLAITFLRVPSRPIL